MEGLTKELLSEVLSRNVNKFRIERTVSFGIQVEYEVSSGTRFYTNIYELAHKCKEWAYTKGMREILSADGVAYIDKENGVLDEGGFYPEQWFSANTEPEAIFKACQWIMEQKDK